MSNFESGVADYITGIATVTVHFPVDDRGRADVSCAQCPYYGRSSRTCQLNKQIVNYPERFIGAACPLGFDESKERGDEQDNF